MHLNTYDVLNITAPGIDYQKFAKNNITIIKDASKIGFIKMKVPTKQNEQASEIIGPIVLSGAPSSNYDLKLLWSNAGMGEYIAIVKVEDLAFNELSDIGDRAIKVEWFRVHRYLQGKSFRQSLYLTARGAAIILDMVV